MKSTLLLFLIGICFLANAQSKDPAKSIKQKQVLKIMRTLASDDMRGRSALVPEDIDKAASFIEKEFKKAGLKPLNGSAGFRQEFQKVKIMLESIEVVASDEVISSDKIIMSSTEESIEINTSSFDSIGKSQKLFPTLLALEKKAGDRVILVAKEHASDFQIAKNYLSQPKILDPGEATSGTKIYILGLHNPTNVSVTAKQFRQNIAMANIVGTLDGKSRPDENVIFSAHYDHIGIQAPIAGDSIANGADDDASGTTAVITLAKYFKKLNSNERTLIFVAFTAEEIGGFGSKYFSQQLNADEVVAMFNIEMIGKLSKWGSNAAFITGFERNDFGEILQENLEGTAVKIYPDPYPEQNLFYRSDNATLARLGVPAHSISTDQIPTDTLYHTVHDEVATLDITNMTSIIKGIAIGAKSIIDGSDTPTRVNKAEVK